MAHRFDVIVVGGGAIGAACARELAATGRKVLVLEAGGEVGQAWRAAGGMLAPQIEADGTDPLLELGIAARDHYDQLAAVLKETTGLDIGLWREGIASIAQDETEATALLAKFNWQCRQGYRSDWLEESELKHRWPWLGPAVGGLLAPLDGALDPEQLVAALLQDARRLGASIVTDRVSSLRLDGPGLTGVVGEREDYAAPEVVIAAGAWSGLIQRLPRPLPIQPVRGQMAALPWPQEIPRAILYHQDSYLLTRSAEAILGSTMEYVGFRAEVTSEGLSRIISATRTLCPGLIRAKVKRSWAGLRPFAPDGLPVIGADPELPGLWYATGHGRNGILLAGLTGHLIAQLISGEQPDQDLRQFAPERFGQA